MFERFIFMFHIFVLEDSGIVSQIEGLLGIELSNAKNKKIILSNAINLISTVSA